MKHATMMVALVLTLGVGAATASALPGRYERGRTLYHERCAVCTRMGWTWTPAGIDPAKVDVMQLALTLSPEAICTWQRRTQRPMTARCPADAMTLAERIDVLYYLRRRLEGEIRAPRLQALPLRKTKHLTSRARTPILRRNAEARERMVRSREEFIRKVLGGRVGPSGRPLAPAPAPGGR
jgi:hypothetical protein